MTTALPPLIVSLLEPQRYPQDVQRVDLIETHISWVLLAGDLAYKIKKPVKLAFLDFSTLAQRQRYCMEELRLNQRFAPDIYLDVVDIVDTPNGPRFGGVGQAIEYAVKMRRFDTQARLDQVCRRGQLQPKHLSDLAHTLNHFHATAPVAPAQAAWGSAPGVIAPVRDNFHDLRQCLHQPGTQARLTKLQDWSEAQFAMLATQMVARKRAGCVRECHGDLHLANMVLIDDQVLLFDCIEFNENLRWIDVANEIAFPYVDLLAHEQGGLACWWVNEVLSVSGDYACAALLRFYAVYRALVRAKVAALRINSTPDAELEALAYIALAEQLVNPAPARLLITHGLSGCGKTVASSALLQHERHANTLRLRSDVERKRLFDLAARERSVTGRSTSTDAEKYSLDANVRTYAVLREYADALLRAGWSVLVDATFLRRADRASFAQLAAVHGVPFAILAPQATPAQLRERIQSRRANGHDASEATLEVLAQQMRVIEPLDANEMPFVNQSGPDPLIELAP